MTKEPFFNEALRYTQDYCQRYNISVEWQSYELTPENWRHTTIPFCDHAGCYLFYDDGGNLLYAGTARSIGGRVASYFRSRPEFTPIHPDWSAPPRHALIIKVSEPWEAASLEHYLIAKLQPVDNSQGIVRD